MLVHENKYAIVYNVYFSSIFVEYFEKNNNYQLYQLMIILLADFLLVTKN